MLAHLMKSVLDWWTAVLMSWTMACCWETLHDICGTNVSDQAIL